MLEDMEKIEYLKWGKNEERDFVRRLDHLIPIALRHAYSDIVEVDVERVSNDTYVLYFCQEDGRCSRSITLKIAAPYDLTQRLYKIANERLNYIKRNLDLKYEYPAIAEE